MLQNSDAEKKVIRRIAVFCGSSRGTERIFEEQAYELGKTLAVQNIELVYGGANVGLMGTVANGVMENGGKAIGVLPAFLKKVDCQFESDGTCDGRYHASEESENE